MTVRYSTVRLLLNGIKINADLEALQASGIRGVNFALRPTSDLLKRIGKALTDRKIVAPPITRIGLDDAPGLFRPQAQSHANGKTVIVL